MQLPKHIYFLGIGGIGMSALARYFNERGVEISGYDKTASPLTKTLETEGMKIHYHDAPELISSDIDLIIWTPAIPKELKEFLFLEHCGVPMKKRSVVLGELTKATQNIAVAGTHGKTTTSILISELLHFAKIKLTAFLGGISVNFQSNYISTGDDWMVEEADEYDRSFLQLHPDVGVIGSLDADHLDIYGSRSGMVQNYLHFASQVKSGGRLYVSDTIMAEEFDAIRNCINPDVQLMRFGFANKECSVEIESVTQGWINFHYSDKQGRELRDLKMRMPGKHNVKNATVAIAIALDLHVSVTDIKNALLQFKGIHRRFEWIYESADAVLIDDYAHHPEELKAAIQACKSCYPDRMITGIFQPHLYSRTRDFLNEFAEVLSGLDQVILVELYPAREKPIEGISSKSIIDKIKNENKILTEKSKLLDCLSNIDTDVVMTLGAGDLDLMLPDIKNVLINKR